MIFDIGGVLADPGKVEEQWIIRDVGLGRGAEEWLNMILEKAERLPSA